MVRMGDVRQMILGPLEYRERGEFRHEISIS